MGMERANERLDAVEGDAGAAELVGEALHDLGSGGRSGDAGDEPVEEGTHVDHEGPG
jgi:hypothetical protein